VLPTIEHTRNGDVYTTRRVRQGPIQNQLFINDGVKKAPGGRALGGGLKEEVGGAINGEKGRNTFPRKGYVKWGLGGTPTPGCQGCIQDI